MSDINPNISIPQHNDPTNEILSRSSQKSVRGNSRGRDAEQLSGASQRDSRISLEKTKEGITSTQLKSGGATPLSQRKINSTLITYESEISSLSKNHTGKAQLKPSKDLEDLGKALGKTEEEIKQDLEQGLQIEKQAKVQKRHILSDYNTEILSLSENHTGKAQLLKPSKDLEALGKALGKTEEEIKQDLEQGVHRKERAKTRKEIEAQIPISSKEAFYGIIGKMNDPEKQKKFKKEDLGRLEGFGAKGGVSQQKIDAAVSAGKKVLARQEALRAYNEVTRNMWNGALSPEKLDSLEELGKKAGLDDKVIQKDMANGREALKMMSESFDTDSSFESSGKSKNEPNSNANVVGGNETQKTESKATKMYDKAKAGLNRFQGYLKKTSASQKYDELRKSMVRWLTNK
jgi:hypothetical protein